MCGDQLLLLMFSAILKLPEHELLLQRTVYVYQTEGETIGITPPIVSLYHAPMSNLGQIHTVPLLRWQ